MGNCCTHNSYKEQIIQLIFSLNVSKLDCSAIKSLFFSQQSNTIKKHIEKLSPESQNLYKNSLLSLSENQFLQIAENHFYSPDNLYQSMFFRKIYELSNKRRAFLYFFIVALSNASVNEKINEFIESIYTLERRESLKYVNLKDILRYYINCALIAPLQALRDSTDDQELINQINTALLQEYNNVNITNFVDIIVQKFEMVNFSEKTDHSEETMVCSPHHVEEILENSKKYFFDVLFLREFFGKINGFD